MSANIGRGAPYRAPCGGWGAKLRIFLGHCFRMWKRVDAKLLVWRNTTVVPDWHESVAGVIPPYQRPNPAYWPCGGVNQIPCGPWPDPPLVNTYAPYSPVRYMSVAVCDKYGYKNCYAWRAHHGRVGFTDNDGCPVAAPGAACFTVVNGPPVVMRYLQRGMSGTAAWYVTNVAGMVGTLVPTADAQIDRTISVNKESGRVTMTGSQVKHGYTWVGGPPPYTDTLTPDPSLLALLAMDYACGVASGDFGGGPDGFSFANLNDPTTWLPARPTTYIDPGTGLPTADWTANGMFVATWRVTNLAIEFAFEFYAPGALGVFTGSITLAQGNPVQDVQKDVYGLLKLWDLTDDRQIPWRTDGLVTSGPLVTRWEAPPAGPPNWLDWNATGPGGSQTYDDGALFDGRILGGPNPPGYEPAFDSRFKVYGKYVDAFGTPYLQLDGYGGFAPSWAPFATQWTDLAMAGWLWPKAFVTYGTPPPGMPGEMSLYVVAGKWAETINPTYGHNFARPCGKHDLEERSEFLTDGTRRPCLDGTQAGWPPRWPTALCDCRDTLWRRDAFSGECAVPGGMTPEHYAAKVAADVGAQRGPNPANDVGRKGDYTIREFQYAFRDVGENGRRITAGGEWNGLPDCDFNPGLAVLRPVTHELTQVSVYEKSAPGGDCARRSACRPFAVFIQPEPVVPDSSPPFWYGFTMPATPPAGGWDARWGSLWVADVRQWMADPLWQAPLPPCPSEGNPPGRWQEDDGTCMGDYYMRPWEECRATVPSQFPALPTGLYLGGSCLPMDQVNLGVTTGFSCLPDGNGVASAGAPQNAWLTYGNLLRRCDGVYGQAAEDRLQDVPELPLFE